MATPRTQYSVLRTCQVRAGFELSSERRGVLQAGQQVDALEQRENETGVVRVRIDRGWVSVKTKGGATVLELVEAPSDPTGLPEDLKDESAKGESYVAKTVRFVRARTEVDVSVEPSANAELAGVLQPNDNAEVQDTRADAGLTWLLLKSAAGTTGWASESLADGSARFEELLPIPMESWKVEWVEIPEAPLASLETEPRDPVFYALPRPEPEDTTMGDGRDTYEREFDMDDADLCDDGVWLFAEAKSVAEVTFPPKTLFLLDMLRSPGHNRDEGTVRTRRRALSAWLQAVHRLLPEDESLRRFFAPAEDGERLVTRCFQFGPAVARSESGSEYVLYTIKCTADGGREWTVRKRFSEFSQLRETLLSQEGSGVDEDQDRESLPSNAAASSDDELRSAGSELIAGDGELRLSKRDANSSLSGMDSSATTATPIRHVTTKSSRVLMSAVVREQREMESPRCGVLRKGSEIVVLEEHENDDGVLRVRYDGGWVSATASNGERILDSVCLQSSKGTATASAHGSQGESTSSGANCHSGRPQVHPDGITGSVAHVSVSVDSASDSNDDLDSRSDAPVRYRIRCTPTNCPEERDENSELGKPSWEVSKRFSDVDQLRTLLIETEASDGSAAVISKLPFPSKIQLNNLFKRTEDIAEERQRELELWLNGVLQICGGNEDLEDFLNEASAQLRATAKNGAAADGEENETLNVDANGNHNDDSDVEAYEGVLFKCVVRSVVRENVAVDSRRCGVLEPDQMIRALEGKRNVKGVLRIKYKGGWVSETDGTKGGTALLVRATKPCTTLPSAASAGRPLRRRRLRNYQCVLSTIATEGPLLDTPTCAEVAEGEIVQVSEAMRDRDGNRRLKCKGRGWVSEINPSTKQVLLQLVDKTDRCSVQQAADTGPKHVSVARPRRYRALLRGVIRTGCALDSEKVGSQNCDCVLSKQRVITALEEVTLPNGQVRVRFEDGWVSVTDPAGRKILALEEESDGQS